MVEKICPKQKILCCELNTGERHKALFHYDESGMQASIYSFDEFFYIKDEAIFLYSENNFILSLHKNVTRRATTSSRNDQHQIKVHKQDVISNTVVIGQGKWEADTPIKKVLFSIKHVSNCFKSVDIGEECLAEDVIFEKKLNQLCVIVGGMKISIYPHSFYDTGEWSQKADYSVIEIEFEEVKTLSNYLDYVGCIVHFFSLLLGVPLVPSNFHVYRGSCSDVMDSTNYQAGSEEYLVKYIWPEIPFSEDALSFGMPLVECSRSGANSESLKNCLKCWITRCAEWKGANRQMMSCLSLNKEISADRLLAACKWFEEIPITKFQKSAILPEDIMSISAEAKKKAIELGYNSDIGGRIHGCLRIIKEETHEDRFRRLIDMVQNVLGDRLNETIEVKKMLYYLKKCMTFRGKVAHGHFYHKNEEEFKLFTRSIYVMETLCFLLMICELPVDNEGALRVFHNPCFKVRWFS